MSDKKIHPPGPRRQLDSHQLLVGYRKSTLFDAVQDAVKLVDPKVLTAELSRHVPEDALDRLRTTGIRPEFVFPTPALLSADPALLGYYRLLLGAPQKTFYHKMTGLGRFKAMEARGLIGKRIEKALSELCDALAGPLAALVRDSDPPLTLEDIRDLQLLTLGSQIQGARNNTIGRQATRQVFLSIRSLIPDPCVVAESKKELRIRNASGREVRITQGSDPDVRFEELIGSATHPRVALEIKGGADHSNAHNRAGEAEKSHQKARGKAFTEFWTIISSVGLDPAMLSKESPTTTHWFELTEILARSGRDWDRFRERIMIALGIPG